MKKIMIAGSGGAPSEGVINSLLRSEKEEEIIGIGSNPSDLILSSAKRKYIVPYADSPGYPAALLKVLNEEKPDLLHFQNDLEIFAASCMREEILKTGTQLFMPDHDVIDTCVNKYKSYLKWEEAGIRVPRNLLLNNPDDLKKAFAELANEEGVLWLRSCTIGGGGKGALPTNDPQLAIGWINRLNGWGNFVAAEVLQTQSVTWLSIWYGGELVVAQSRKREGWVHANRTLSGITGVTKKGITFSDDKVNSVANSSIKAIDKKPHGIYGVDLTYDSSGFPNPTEINISRFFTTILFFTEAGLNMPVIFKDLALYGEYPGLKKKINPLPDGLVWLRGMDTKPRLTTEKEIKDSLIQL